MMEQDHKRKLRIGILIDGLIQPRWVHRIIQDIQRSSHSEISLVVHNEARTAESDKLLRKIVAKRHHVLWAAYVRMDIKLFRPVPSAFDELDVGELVQGCPRLSTLPIQKGFVDYFHEADVKEIQSYNLDVALRFGFRIIKGDVLTIARHGVWSFHHDDNFSYRGGPAGFWEILENNPVTGSILQKLTSRLDAGQVIYRSWSQTQPFSLARNREQCFWKSANFVTRKLKELHDAADLTLDEESWVGELVPYSGPLYKTPTNAQMLPFLFKIFWRMAKYKLQRLLFRDQWCLAYKIHSSGRPALHFYDFQYMMPPSDRFWADPFPVALGTRYCIFLEEFMYSTSKGHVSVIEIDEHGKWTPPRKVLERDYHMSYPFVFQWNGDYYMIPETHRNRTIELYKCSNFPDRWELDRVLMENVIAVDTTLYEDNDIWWMFVNMAKESESHNDELHLFYADSPLGPWQEHPQNPIRSDVRCARPAGHLFRSNGHLYRPSQDCSKRYGYAVTLNKIAELDKRSYSEEAIGRIEPFWRKDLHGVHTLGHAGRLTVIDCLTYRRVF